MLLRVHSRECPDFDFSEDKYRQNRYDFENIAENIFPKYKDL
jgi:hypothetical protein